MAEPKKREKDSNFSDKEIILLIKTIQEYKNIIQRKKTDAATWRDKDTAKWENVTEAFNSSSGEVFRSKKTLKAKYEDMRKILRRNRPIIERNSLRLVNQKFDP